MQDIRTDKHLVAVLDELSHRMKPLKTPMGTDFREALRQFIVKWKLDGDPHSFAALPERDTEAR